MKGERGLEREEGREDRGLHIDALKPHSSTLNRLSEGQRLLPLSGSCAVPVFPFTLEKVFKPAVCHRMSSGAEGAAVVFVFFPVVGSSSEFASCGASNRLCQLEVKGAPKVFGVMEEPLTPPPLPADQLFMTAKIG